MNNIVTNLFIAFHASCSYSSQYLWRKIGGMLFVYSLLELRTLPNELLLYSMLKSGTGHNLSFSPKYYSGAI